MKLFTDVVIIGAGAAGMMCAIQAGRRGRSVLIIDHAQKLAEKIRISGGGRCNFTNLYTKPECYQSENPHFCRSALARFTPQDFINLVEAYGIQYHEKKLGQLFCDDSAQQIIAMLRSECDAAHVAWQMPSQVQKIIHQIDDQAESNPTCFIIQTEQNRVACHALVIATGGLSIPQIGATPFGYQIAEQFGLRVTNLRPGLVGLTVTSEDFSVFKDIAGVSIEVAVHCNNKTFQEMALFTHRGLSGPAILQISSYWQPGQSLQFNLLPRHNAQQLFSQHCSSEMLLTTLLSRFLPKRFVQAWCVMAAKKLSVSIKPINQYHQHELLKIAEYLHNWPIQPSGTVGYKKAEVTLGGVDTNELSSKTMMSKKIPGLYFIGEVVDVTGHLGGFNFQWAWSSGYAAGQFV